MDCVGELPVSCTVYNPALLLCNKLFSAADKVVRVPFEVPSSFPSGDTTFMVMPAALLPLMMK